MQAGRRDNWWTETSCVLIFFFFVWKKRLSRRVTDGIVVCRREKRFCESRVPAAVVHLFSDYTITTILYYIHRMGSTRKKKKRKNLFEFKRMSSLLALQ